MNILLLSVGTRNKVVQYFRQQVQEEGRVIATDCSSLAPAIYEADQYYIVPKITDADYITTIIEICQKEKVDILISFIDPELSLIAQNKERFQEIGVEPIISDYDKVELCFDKYKMFQFLEENEIPTIKSYVDKDAFYQDLEEGNIQFPVFVKPIKGSASININKVVNKQQIETLFSQYDNLMIQEFMEGEEYGADVYIDMISKKVVAIFTKMKLKMRAGETDKAVSIKDEELFQMIEKFVEKAGFCGIIDIDIFKVNHQYYISEVNPRFGGGYPHAYECGVNVPAMIIKNKKGIENKKQIGNYEENIYMMKYNEIKIIKG